MIKNNLFNINDLNILNKLILINRTFKMKNKDEIYIYGYIHVIKSTIIKQLNSFKNYLYLTK